MLYSLTPTPSLVVLLLAMEKHLRTSPIVFVLNKPLDVRAISLEETSNLSFSLFIKYRT
mgnify:CR=1 FL=1